MQTNSQPTKAPALSGAPRLQLLAALVAGQVPEDYVRAVTGESIDLRRAADELTVLEPRWDD